jgi:hypothetical protein
MTTNFNQQQQDELFDIGVIDHESHQQVINKLKEKWFSLYVTQENRWKRKIRMYRDKLREMEQKIQDACSLGSEALTCRAPSIIHSIYLHGKWTQFIIKQLADGRLHKITYPKEFIIVFFNVIEHET